MLPVQLTSPRSADSGTSALFDETANLLCFAFLPPWHLSPHQSEARELAQAPSRTVWPGRGTPANAFSAFSIPAAVYAHAYSRRLTLVYTD
jgi:hypothetical protein